MVIQNYSAKDLTQDFAPTWWPTVACVSDMDVLWVGV